MASDKTDARRERMRTLWIKTDQQVAEILIEEGYGGPIPRTADGRRRQVETMRRNVWNDRQWHRKKWRSEKAATHEDAHETRGEYLAVLDSYKEVGVDIISDPKMKGTPRVQALVALTRIEEAKAKARGVAESVAPPTDDERPAVPFLGVVVGINKLSADALKKIDGWSGKRRKGKNDDGEEEEK